MSRRAVGYVADHVLAARAPAERACRSFYFDVTLLEDYWVRRKYHHTMSASLIYALRRRSSALKKKGCKRAGRGTSASISRSRSRSSLGLSLLPSPGERLWTLNAVTVPEGVDDLAVRKGCCRPIRLRLAPASARSPARCGASA